MQKLKIVGLLTAGVLALAAIFGAATVGKVYAQVATPDAGTAATTTTGRLARGMEGRGGGHGERMGGMEDTYLADALGITTDELRAAEEAAKTKALAQAVDAGLLTQEEADALASRAGHVPGGRGWMNDGSIDFDALLAEELGISTADLQTAKQTAMQARLDQAVADGELTAEEADLIQARQALMSNETFQASMQAAYESGVQQAVEDGVITQAQADQILAQPFGKGGGMGHFGGRP